MALAQDYTLEVTPELKAWSIVDEGEYDESLLNEAVRECISVHGCVSRYDETSRQLYSLVSKAIKEQFPGIRPGDRVVIGGSYAWYVDPETVIFASENSGMALPPEFTLFHNNLLPSHWPSELFNNDDMGIDFRINPLYRQKLVGEVVHKQTTISSRPPRFHVQFLLQPFEVAGETFYMIGLAPTYIPVEDLQEYMRRTTVVEWTALYNQDTVGHEEKWAQYNARGILPRMLEEILSNLASQHGISVDDFRKKTFVASQLLLTPATEENEFLQYPLPSF